MDASYKLPSLMMVLAAAAACLALAVGGETAAQPDAFRVSAAPPTVVTTIAPGRSYIVRIDGSIVTCDLSYGLYVRLEKKGSPLIFQYVLPGAGILRSSKDVPLTVACLKVEPGVSR